MTVRALASALLAALVVLAVAPREARAHATHPSYVQLDVGPGAVDAAIEIPLTPLGLALDRPLDADPGALLPALEAPLRAYVAAHFGASTPDGRAFALTVATLGLARRDGVDELAVRATLRPPRGGDTRAFVLRDDVVLHRVVSHRIVVLVRHDFRLGRLDDAHADIVGLLHYQHTTLALDRSAGSAWRGARAVFALGMRHIAEGTDHLLFLLALLLPAPLVARRRRWVAGNTVRASLRDVLRLVTAFTLGHSLTLVLAATGLVRLPSAPVEVLIAGSILVSAAHALRPLFPGREPLVAGAFGLVHGLAFASTIAHLGLDASSLAMGVLAFNLGIEAMQLAIVACVVPCLLLLARSRAYTVVRTGGAAFAMLAACGWLVERALGWRNPFAAPVDALAHHPLPALAALAALAVGLEVRRQSMRYAYSSPLVSTKRSRSGRAAGSVAPPRHATGWSNPSAVIGTQSSTP